MLICEMRERVVQWRYSIQESLWFLPSVLTFTGAVLALVMVRIDHSLGLDQRESRFWAFGGGAEGARGVLQAIAGSLITVTGTVFSITIVTLQLASTQFTPRVLSTFTRDRGVQLVFGVFIATFTYAILVLREVRSKQDDFESFVPSISVLVAILLVLVCVGFLIYIIHHVAQMIRVPAVVERVVQDGERLINERFPSKIGDPIYANELIDPPSGKSHTVVRSTRAGYLQSIAVDALFGLATDGPMTIRLELLIGSFVFEGETIATIWPMTDSVHATLDTIRDSQILGAERTLAADVALPIRQLADIAIKALSPGINDPTTAVACIDRLGHLLLRMARLDDPPSAYCRQNSSVRLIVPSATIPYLLEEAFGQIRHFGANDAHVMAHLIDVLERMVELAPPARQFVIRQQAELCRSAIRRETVS